MKRVVVLLEEQDFKNIKRKAGLVPLSAWIRNQLVQPDSEGQNGSTNHQDVRRVSKGVVPRRRTGAVGRRSLERTVRGIDGTVTERVGRTIESPRENKAEIHASRSSRNNDSVSDAAPVAVTRENFAELAANIPKDDLDRWARSRPAEVLPSHSATAIRTTCLCLNCLTWRKTNDIPYGGAPKKENRFKK